MVSSCSPNIKKEILQHAPHPTAMALCLSIGPDSMEPMTLGLNLCRLSKDTFFSF